MMFLDLGSGVSFLVLVFLFIVFIKLFHVLREYERAVVFTLGRFTGAKGPGLIVVIPFLQHLVRVDLRVVTLDIPPQAVISRDNVSVQVNAVVYFRVVDPGKAIIQVEHYLDATSQLAQTTLRAVLGKHELDDMLIEREKLNLDIQTILDMQTDGWGIKVTNVEIKDIGLNDTMVRAMARQAEAERDRRAKIIHAEGERQAAQALADAARTLAQEPTSMQLRYLETLTQVAGDKSSTLVLPIPIDLLTNLMGQSSKTPRPPQP
jgi:regulator of protease activity HflC (stomatin/prohibitin superfamily)